MDLFSKNDEYSQFSYEKLKKTAEKCTKCPLHKGRTKVVFGHGPVPCDLMLIGEGPGENEDLSGLPFVGRAGKLLTKIFESVNIDREKQVYIANIVKCRPPKNRAPLANETEACFPYLRAQIRLINPKIILLAGAPSTKVVLGKTDPMGSLRGKWFKLPGTNIDVMPIFHPSYLLRNASKNEGGPKWHTWNDMKEVVNALEFHKKVRELEGSNQ
ncbi:MAG: uracil-DNA glycosylase [Candidatus Margulisbacteria bacterium]|nr:uracil-DNA glycosylase [Candidatus Margulisiibacteriota bacterium]MBU1021568.1 uracil-DNA glycosylase [Candidatus Margulisiibacteriota bacterium]MBU1728719.1 uracil-DNA glycosylase [Candidatus Margulisiibacteriota bacterium]MBU1955170.1 uracil-DNA glycosylase [Candidatus Margulisiibacteriota bacterium]